MKAALKPLTIGVAVITYRAKAHLPKCLPPLLNSPLKPRVLVVNSSSNDGTVELAKEMGAETVVIPRIEFNHGSTRELARKTLGTDIVVMVTPDAYAENEAVLGKLVDPLIQGKASVSYARQLPHFGATFFETFARDFNYPSVSHIRNLKDYASYGVYTYFCSDSFAAYLNSALDEIGGFSDVLTGEDTVAVAKLLNKGGSIAYAAEAKVHHSHAYTLSQEFRRHFDTGLARQGYQDLIPSKGSDEKRGRAYMIELFRRLAKEKPFLIPYAMIQTVVKYAGYRIGRASATAPIWWKRFLSAQDFYWMEK